MRRIICVVLAMMLLLYGCGKTNPSFLTEIASISLSGGKTRAAEKEMKEFLVSLENEIGVNVVGSDLYKLNRAMSGQRISVGMHTRALFSLCAQYYQSTNQSFDPSLLPASELWGFSPQESEPHIPDESALSAVRADCDFQAFTLVDDCLTKQKSGAKLDFGGIAKGYAANKLRDIAKKHGVTSGIIDLGGNLMLIGDKDGQPFRVGVTDPRPQGDSRGYFCTLNLQDTSAVTSGDYNNFFEQDGVRYCHIISPKTLSPVQNELVSVTVVDEDSAKADALSTALFVMGLNEAILYAQANDVNLILITSDRKYFTRGLDIKNIAEGYQPI